MRKGQRTAVVKLLVLAMCFILGRTSMRAQRVNDSITVSLLTCSPGSLVYELYGHTALRIEDHTLATDLVFNYGAFDFNQPHFAWRFMLGQTDYAVQPLPFTIFFEEYMQRGSRIESQRLNLTRIEANTLYNNLIVNAQPQNRTYRYNFLTCNCTTRVRDMVEAAIHGHVTYREQPKTSYRESLHAFTKGSPWAELGNDILLGASTDTLLSDRTMQFLPFRLRDYFAQAVVCDSTGSELRPLASEVQVLLPESETPEPQGFPLSPLACALIFVGVLLLVFALEYFFKFQCWFIDFLLMPGVGAAGLLVTFMFFFSEHPSMNSNWQIWVLNPLPLCCMPWVVWSAIKHKRCAYHYGNAVVLAIFLIAVPWIPQHFCLFTVPLALGLLTRSVSYMVNFNRLQVNGKKTTRRKK